MRFPRWAPDKAESSPPTEKRRRQAGGLAARSNARAVLCCAIGASFCSAGPKDTHTHAASETGLEGYSRAAPNSACAAIVKPVSLNRRQRLHLPPQWAGSAQTLLIRARTSSAVSSRKECCYQLHRLTWRHVPTDIQPTLCIPALPEDTASPAGLASGCPHFAPSDDARLGSADLSSARRHAATRRGRLRLSERHHGLQRLRFCFLLLQAIVSFCVSAGYKSEQRPAPIRHDSR